MSKVKVGDTVTCKTRKAAYYSGYAGRPVCFFEPGEVGTVAAVDVPAVITLVREDNPGKRTPTTFQCVDFEKFGAVWRVSLYDYNIKKIKTPPDSVGKG